MLASADINPQTLRVGAGRVLRWQYQSNAGYPFVPQPRAENAVYFAYTEVMVDEAREVWLDFGADDDSKLWLNGDLVWTSGAAEARNTLLFKLYNGIDLMFFAVVLSPVNPNP
jgi:hypothetical protein